LAVKIARSTLLSNYLKMALKRREDLHQHQKNLKKEFSFVSLIVLKT
jgi:hypothetical protein